MGRFLVRCEKCGFGSEDLTSAEVGLWATDHDCNVGGPKE
jgi:hypothetical protein